VQFEPKIQTLLRLKLSDPSTPDSVGVDSFSFAALPPVTMAAHQ
jgi:hypothetical protein